MQRKPDPFPVTREYFDLSQKEFDRLTEYRKEVLVRLQAAREMGDLSENGAYTAARFEQRTTDRNLRKYKYILLFAEVREPEDDDIVSFGSYVTLKLGSKEVKYRLVSKHEADPKKQTISIVSPIGMALMGKKVGDVATIKTSAGDLSYKVLKIEK